MADKSLYQRYVMGKYEKLALEVLDKSKWLSTNKVKILLQKKHNKTINWHILFRALSTLEKGGKVEHMEVSRLFLWRKR